MMLTKEDREARAESSKFDERKAKALKAMIKSDGYKYLQEEVEQEAVRYENLSTMKLQDMSESEIASLVKTNQAVAAATRGILNRIENYVKEVLKNG